MGLGWKDWAALEGRGSEQEDDHGCYADPGSSGTRDSSQQTHSLTVRHRLKDEKGRGGR